MADPTSVGRTDGEAVNAFARRLATRLGVPANDVEPGYEDVLYYLWKEGTLPENIDVLNGTISDKLERVRLRRLFERRLERKCGLCAPARLGHGCRGIDQLGLDLPSWSYVPAAR